MKKGILGILLVCTAVLLTVLLTACGGDSTQNASEGLDFTLSKSGDYYTVTGIGDCTDSEVVIPSRYERKPVEAIGGNAFANCANLLSVTIPDSIAKLGDNAFRGCSALTIYCEAGQKPDSWA